jgi:hypothetical protein
VWHAAFGVIANAQATSVHTADGETAAFFAGTVGDQPVDGVLRARAHREGAVTDVTLMVRPLAALKAGMARISP